MARKSGILEFLKTIFSGLVGAGIMLMVSVFAFAVVKLVFMYLKQDLLLSKYNIITIAILFAFLGFALGISAYLRKSQLYKLLKVSWSAVLIDILVTAICGLAAYLVMKYRYGILLGGKGIIAAIIVLFIIFYLFSAIIANYLREKRSRVKGHKARNIVLAVLFNPVFILVYIWLFGMVAYNSVYIPCGVVIEGVDRNPYTANTISLDIPGKELIVSIDGIRMNSLQDIKSYIGGLESTREVSVETNSTIYYIRTYALDGQRYMGLILRQRYCYKQYS